MLLGYDYHNVNTYKHGNSYLLWEVDKDNIANQSAISLIIRATGICWNQVVCKGMARNKGISLKQNTDILLVLYVFTFVLIYIIILARKEKVYDSV